MASKKITSIKKFQIFKNSRGTATLIVDDKVDDKDRLPTMSMRCPRICWVSKNFILKKYTKTTTGISQFCSSCIGRCSNSWEIETLNKVILEYETLKNKKITIK